MEPNPFDIEDYPPKYIDNLLGFLRKEYNMAKPKVLPGAPTQGMPMPMASGMPMGNPAAPKPKTGFPYKPFKKPVKKPSK
jgi:hypothetical protein